MASEIQTVFPSGGDHAPLKKPCEVPPTLAKPVLDQEGNVLPYPGYNSKAAEEKYCKPSPIARLAMAADLNKPIPTAGWYGIEKAKAPILDIPPESYLYDEHRPWVLCKLNKAALSVPEPAEPVPLSRKLTERLNQMEAAANVDYAIRHGFEVIDKQGKTIEPVAAESQKGDALKKQEKPKPKVIESPARTSKTSTGNPRTPRVVPPSQRGPSKSPGRNSEGRVASAPKVVNSQRSATATKKTVNTK